MSTEFAFPSPFRAKPFEQRRSIATKVRMDYQQKKVPCIVEVAKQTPGNTLTGLPRSKYLVSANAPASSLKDAILSDAGLAADAPLQLFYAQSGAELPYTEKLGLIDSKFKNEDGFLYVAALMIGTIVVDATIVGTAGDVPGEMIVPATIVGAAPASPAAKSAAPATSPDPRIVSTPIAPSPLSRTASAFAEDVLGVSTPVAAPPPATAASPLSVEKRPVPYAKALLDAKRTPPGNGGAPLGGTGTANPHGERVPEGATIASCTFLNPRASGKLLPPLMPTLGGKTPSSLYLAIILDVTAVGLVVPLLAAYSRSLGAGARFTGLLQATYGLAQLIGANVLGGLSDTAGRRTMLLLSTVGGAIGYALLALAVSPSYGSLPLLLLSRLPIGLLKQSLTVSRALVTDTTNIEGRLRPMARVGGCVGIGFVLGPGLGGALSKKIGLLLPPILASCLFVLSNLVILFFLPETAPLPLSKAELKALLHLAEARWGSAIATLAMKEDKVIGVTYGANGLTTQLLTPSIKGGIQDARTHAVITPLALPQATSLCEQLLSKWAPNGLPIAAAEQSELLSSWKATLVAKGDSMGYVKWVDFKSALCDEYCNYKVGQGMLHAESGIQLAASMGGSASKKGQKAASGSGGGSSDAAEEEDVGVFSAAKRTWTSKSMPQVRRLLFARAMVELSVMIFHSTFADYVLRKYEWDQKKTGYGMALAGGLSVLVDLIIVPILHSYKMLGVLPAGLIGGVLVASGLLSLSVAVKTDGFFLGLTLLSLGTALFKSNFNTIVMGVAKQVNSRSTTRPKQSSPLPSLLTRSPSVSCWWQHEAGIVSGACDMMEAICRVVAPIAGGMLLEQVYLEGPPLVGSMLALAGAAVLYEVAPSEMRRAISTHGLGPPPAKAKAA